MGPRKITEIINRELKEDNVRDSKEKIMIIEKTEVNIYLKSVLGRPRKVRLVFYLNDMQRRERVKFCENILEKRIRGEHIFFTYKTKIDMAPFFK